jgi:transcriptional regulator with XRE-family HTH domain
MRDDWESRSDSMEAHLPRLDRYPVAGLVRRARRIADLSQREMARRAGVAPSTVGRVESGEQAPSLDLLTRLLDAAGLWLVVTDGEGHVVTPMRESDETRDGGDRRYPSHLDTILDPRPGDWWADQYGLARPPETYYRDRRRRDEMRARSRWEVRVALLRNAPEPPRPGAREARFAAADEARAELRERLARGDFPPDAVPIDELEDID